MPTQKQRYTVIDLIRGFAILNMVVFHALWNLVNIYDIDIPWFQSDFVNFYQLFGRWVFVLISGFCRPVSRQKLSRGFLVLLFACIITFVTEIFVPDSPIYFGILSLIGTGMLLSALLDKFYKKLNPYIGFAFFIVLFVFTQNVNIGEISVGSWHICDIPESWYKNMFTAYLGFAPDGFYSSDYFPLIPWLFLYQAGHFLFYIFARLDLLKHLSFIRIRWLEWIGRKTLYVYILHQPIIYGIMYLYFGY